MNRIKSESILSECQYSRWRMRLTYAVLLALSSTIGPQFLDVAVAQPFSTWMATPTLQVNGARTKLPLNYPVSPQSNLSLTVDTRWSNGYGYRPVQVTVISLQPSKLPQFIRLRIHGGWGTSLNNAEQEFELPAGAVQASTTIALPQYQSSGQILWWEVWVNGVRDKDLSFSAEESFAQLGSLNGSASGLTFLAVDPAVPPVGSGSTSSSRSLVTPNTSDFEVLSLGISEFPRRWIDYTCFDVVLLSHEQLVFLSGTNPEAFRALMRWLRTGGQLWVNEIGLRFEYLDELAKLLSLQSSIAPAVQEGVSGIAGAGGETAVASNEGAWRPVRFRSRNREGQVVTFLDLTTGSNRVARDPDSILRLQGDPNYVVLDQRFEPLEENPERRWPPDSAPWFVDQDLGLGVVRAFRETSEVALFLRRQQPADPNATFDDDAQQRVPRAMAMSLRSVDRWNARHGLAPDDYSRDFANLLVPGVGLAPVTEFRVLITAFVILIGPVNYWLLKRWRRLHLLVLTVPLAAALMTAALFAYATVADGFGTTVRVHSFTVLDQRTGEAACWARLSYYSGLAPRGGLTMPDDVVLYPINPTWSASRIDAHLGIDRDLKWHDSEARLSRGWLRSRTPTQYLTIRSRQTPRRLELAGGGDKLRATNKLDAAIEFLIVNDRDGKLWIGRKLPTGSVKFLQPIDRVDAIRGFREVVIANAPEPPIELAGEGSNYSLVQRQPRFSQRGRFGFPSDDVQLGNNLVADKLSDLAGLSGQPALMLPSQSYVAVTATGPEVELGLGHAEEEASFHVIVGQW